MLSSISHTSTPRISPHLVRVDLTILAAILVLAAFLRLNRLDLIDVRFDEASAPFLAKGIAQGNLLPVAPFSGSVATHPPLYLYALALPYLFTRNFMAIATYRVLLDVIAVAACWFICRRYFNARAAVIATLLFAVAPWAVQFSRKLWLAPLPMFSMVLLFGLLESVQRKNPWGWAIAGMGLALCIGAHLASLYLAPVVLFALIIGRKTLRVWPCVVGALPLLALAAVYLGFDSRQDFANVRALLGASGAGGQFTLDALRFALWSSGGAHLSDLTGNAFPFWQAQLAPVFDLIDALQMAMLVVGAVALAYSLFSRRAPYDEWKPAIAILLLWLILPAMLQLRPARPLQVHYFIPLYPVPFIVVALGLDFIIRAMRTEPMRKSMAWLSSGVILVIVAWQVFTTLRFTDFIEHYDTSNGGYGPPIRAALDAAHLAREAVRSGQANDVIVAAPGGDPAVNESATVMDVLLADVPHRFANADAGLILRDDDAGAQYIFTPDTQRAFDMLMQHVTSTGVVTRVVPSGDRNYIYARVGEAQLSGAKEQPAQWANGVRLIGYAVGEGDPIPLRIYLRASPQAAGADNHYYNHLYRGDRKVGAQDGGGIHPSNWRAGDILLHWFEIPRPQEGFDRIRIGVYRYPQIEMVMVVDEAGNPVSDGVDLK